MSFLVQVKQATGAGHHDFNASTQLFDLGLFTYATVHAGGSFSSTIKDEMELGNSVFINTAPVAVITTGPACVGVGMPFEADASTENVNVNTAYDYVKSYDWDFDNDGLWDGINLDSTGYTFNSAGTYPVRLLVEDVFGCLDSVTLNVTPQAPPTADFGQSVTTSQWCEDFIFDYEDFSLDVNNDPVVAWEWTLPDATVHTTQDVTHSYAECLWNEVSPGSSSLFRCWCRRGTRLANRCPASDSVSAPCLLGPHRPR